MFKGANVDLEQRFKQMFLMLAIMVSSHFVKQVALVLFLVAGQNSRKF